MKTISIEEVLSEKNIQIIDLRSPIEFEEDHILGALNFPILSNEERAEVGTLYKKDPDRAKNLALVYGHEKLADLQQKLQVFSKDHQQVVFYCYRGGMRSGLLVKHLESLGYPVVKLEGGYKRYRAYVREQLKVFGETMTFNMLHGYTGVGKTRILNLLEAQGIPVLDLEGLAQNAGSVFGDLMYPGTTPSQKLFESRMFSSLSSINEGYCFVEMESRRIGKVTVPEELYRGLTNSPYHILVNTSLKNRVTTIHEDYVKNHALTEEDLLQKIQRLKKILGKDKIEALSLDVEKQNYEHLIETLMLDYYDPLYRKSLKKYEGKLTEFTYHNLSEDLSSWLEKNDFIKNA